MVLSPEPNDRPSTALLLRRALQAVEWGAEVDAQEGGFVAGCPSCGAEKRTGTHHPECQLKAALDLPEDH